MALALSTKEGRQRQARAAAPLPCTRDGQRADDGRGSRLLRRVCTRRNRPSLRRRPGAARWCAGTRPVSRAPARAPCPEHRHAPRVQSTGTRPVSRAPSSRAGSGALRLHACTPPECARLHGPVAPTVHADRPTMRAVDSRPRPQLRQPSVHPARPADPDTARRCVSRHVTGVSVDTSRGGRGAFCVEL